MDFFLEELWIVKIWGSYLRLFYRWLVAGIRVRVKEIGGVCVPKNLGGCGHLKFMIYCRIEDDGSTIDEFAIDGGALFGFIFQRELGVMTDTKLYSDFIRYLNSQLFFSKINHMEGRPSPHHTLEPRRLLEQYVDVRLPFELVVVSPIPRFVLWIVY